MQGSQGVGCEAIVGATCSRPISGRQNVAPTSVERPAMHTTPQMAKSLSYIRRKYRE